jgi:outer membrane protein OmpA-like peptidoglycan-associated protein
MKFKLLAATLMLSVFNLSGFAQTATQTTVTQTTTLLEPVSSTPLFRVNEISGSVDAVDYQHHSGATKVDFVGTSLMPTADGHAKVNTKRGTMAIGAEFAGLVQPQTFGNEYLTYVMWAISPEGHASNLGEVLVGDNQRSKLNVTTDMQSFALIVTAEPYFAVREPSNVVVLQNIVRNDTKGTVEAVNAKYELMERGGYIPTGYKYDPVVINHKQPLEYFEARNALRIAQSEGADFYANDSYQHAVQLMNTTDADAVSMSYDKRPMIASARETVQTAEDAREIAVKKMDDMRLAEERQASANATAVAETQTDEANRQKNLAQSEAANAQAQAADAQAQMAANQVKSAAAVTAAQTDAANAQAAMATNQEASAAALAAAESDKEALRSRLITQLNLILQTRDSARGLIISMSDVLFNTGQYSLKSDAREKLAKVAGILMAYPSLNIAVGGYTDNVGGDAMNQTLSENRAGSVRNYLVQQGVVGSSVSAQGFGNTMPVSSNESAEGRQQNRRVELLVTGDAIGTAVNVTMGSLN